MIYVIVTINVRYRVRRCFSEILGQQRFLTHAITFKLTEIVTILSRTSWIVGMDINKPNSNANWKKKLYRNKNLKTLVICWNRGTSNWWKTHLLCTWNVSTSQCGESTEGEACSPSYRNNDVDLQSRLNYFAILFSLLAKAFSCTEIWLLRNSSTLTWAIDSIACVYYENEQNFQWICMQCR